MTPSSERTRTFLAATNSFILLVFLTAAYPVYAQDGKPEAPPKPWQINGVNATLNDPDLQVWVAAIQQENFVQVLKAMGEAGAKHAPQVAALLSDQNWQARRAAAAALGARGEAGAKHAP